MSQISPKPNNIFTDRNWFLADLQPLAKGFFFFCFFVFFLMTSETAKPENREKSSNPSGKEACVNVHRRLRNQSFFLSLWRRLNQRIEKRLLITVAKEHVCMQHIETDQFAQSRVSVVVSPARAASVFYSLCAVV